LFLSLEQSNSLLFPIIFTILPDGMANSMGKVRLLKFGWFNGEICANGKAGGLGRRKKLYLIISIN